MLPKPFVTLISVTALGLTVIATGCGRGAKGGANADSAEAVDTAAARASAAGDSSASAKPAAEASPDSIPMDITVVVSGAGGGGDGTFHSTGNGRECSFNPNATPRPPDTEWTVKYYDARMNGSARKYSGLYSLQMDLGKTANGTTDQMTVRTAAGQITAAGMTVPGSYTIGTFKSGAVEGSATAKVTREGDGVRIEINGTRDGTKLKITVACKRLSH